MSATAEKTDGVESLIDLRAAGIEALLAALERDLAPLVVPSTMPAELLAPRGGGR